MRPTAIIVAIAALFLTAPADALEAQESAALWVYVYRADSGSLDPFRVVANPASDWSEFDLEINVTYGQDARTSEHVNDAPVYADDGPVELASLTLHEGAKPQLSAVTAVRVAGMRCPPARQQSSGRSTYACNPR